KLKRCAVSVHVNVTTPLDEDSGFPNESVTVATQKQKQENGTQRQLVIHNTGTHAQGNVPCSTNCVPGSMKAGPSSTTLSVNDEMETIEINTTSVATRGTRTPAPEPGVSAKTNENCNVAPARPLNA